MQQVCKVLVLAEKLAGVVGKIIYVILFFSALEVIILNMICAERWFASMSPIRGSIYIHPKLTHLRRSGRAWTN